MIKKALIFSVFSVFCLLMGGNFLMAEIQDVVGFWTTIDDKTGVEESVIGIYEYQGKYYGRIVATYDKQGKIAETLSSPTDRAPGVKGHPFYVGMDIIWDLSQGRTRYEGGKILDPEKGHVYDVELWVEDGKLIVRGKFLFFGRNQTWIAADDQAFLSGSEKPDLSKFVPLIPEVD